MWSAELEVAIEPATASCADCVPFTKIRSVAPSYVVATWLQAPTGSVDVPFSDRCVPPTEISPPGKVPFVFEYMP